MRIEGIIPMPKFSSLGELVEFFDTHDLGEYWDSMPKAHLAALLRHRSARFGGVNCLKTIYASASLSAIAG